MKFSDVIVFLVIFAVVALVGIDSHHVAQAATNSTNFKWEVGISGYAVSNPTASTALTVPASAIHATFTVTGGPLCVSKGTAVPTPTNSERWPEGFVAMVDNDAPMLRRMKVINCDNSDPATVQIYFRRQWQSGDSQ